MLTHENPVNLAKYFWITESSAIYGWIVSSRTATTRDEDMVEPHNQISELLLAWNNGDESSLERLVPVVESELKRIARNFLRRENANRSLQTSDLINEAYLKLVGQREVRWQNRSHFFAVASIIIRRILINHARDRKAGKRGGGVNDLNIENVYIVSRERTDELISLDEALTKLAEFDQMKGRIVEMRYFGGLTAAETAEVLNITPAAVTRHWNLARAWLAREMRK